MEEIKESVLAILPDIDNDVLESLVILLKDIGVKTFSDLALVEKSDINGLLVSFQVRKLINTWVPKNSKYPYFSLSK